MKLVLRAITLHTILAFSCLNYGFAQLEGDCIRKVGKIKVDGDLTGWRSYPYVVYGSNTLSEDKLSAVSWMGWSSEGIYLALRICCDTSKGSIAAQRAKGLGRDKVDLFLDTRAPGVRMDRYFEGVYHFSIRVFSETHVPDIVRIGGPPNLTKSLQANGYVVASRKLADGWAVEAFMPWTALGNYKPKEGEWIAFSTRVVYTDPNSSASLAIGARTVNASNPLESVPLAFTPIEVLGPLPKVAPFSIRAEEVVIRGQPWLDFEVVAASEFSDVQGKSLKLEIPDLGVNAVLPFIPSYSGRYWMITEHYPLATANITDGAVRIHLSEPGSDWKTVLAVPTRVARRFGLIDAELPAGAIGMLAEPERGIANVLKIAAKEGAANLTASPDGHSAPQKLFRVILNPRMYDPQIALFVNEAKKLLAGEKVGAGYYFRGWHSKTMRTWLPIQISVPVNLDSRRKYPVNIRIDANGHGSTTAFMNVLKSYDDGTGIDYRGDRFQIWPFGWDISDTHLGDEELAYIFGDLIPSLPVDMSKVSISGYSIGARTALRLALRNPDRYAWLQARSGNFNFLGKEFGSEEVPQLLDNLSHSGVFLEAGERDKVCADSSKGLFQQLQADRILSEYRERPNEGHNFIEDVVSPRISSITVPCCPQTVSFATLSVDYGTSYWLTIDSIVNYGKLAKVAGSFIDKNDLNIETNNVHALSINCSYFANQQFPLTITVDGGAKTVLETRPPTKAAHLALDGLRWENGAAPTGLNKRLGLCGPAGRVESGPILIVYGTKDTRRAFFLKERAFRILMNEQVGAPDEGQWASNQFVIKADSEVTGADLESDNLWLIGGSTENSVVAGMASWLPGDSSAKFVFLGKKRFSTPDVLLSYIFPHVGTNDRYVYVELGTSDRAYLGSILAAPDSDACGQVISDGKAFVIWKRNFDAQWEMADSRPE